MFNRHYSFLLVILYICMTVHVSIIVFVNRYLHAILLPGNEQERRIVRWTDGRTVRPEMLLRCLQLFPRLIMLDFRRFLADLICFDNSCSPSNLVPERLSNYSRPIWADYTKRSLRIIVWSGSELIKDLSWHVFTLGSTALVRCDPFFAPRNSVVDWTVNVNISVSDPASFNRTLNADLRRLDNILQAIVFLNWFNTGFASGRIFIVWLSGVNQDLCRTIRIGFSNKSFLRKCFVSNNLDTWNMRIRLENRVVRTLSQKYFMRQRFFWSDLFFEEQ